MANLPNESTLSVEEQLERVEKEVGDLRHALDQSSIIAFTDSKGTITYVNDRFCEISKYDRSELIGQNHRIVNSGYHPKTFFTELWRTISSGQVWKGEIKNRAKDGSFYWVFTTIVPFMTPNGRPFKYISIRVDITQQKLEHEEAERQRAALAHSEKLASVGELAAGIAHELGNPLGAIRGRMEFLKMRLGTGEIDRELVAKTTQTVEQLVDRMSGIIRGMQAMSRDGGNDPFQLTPVGRMIQDVLSFTHESFQKHGIKVVVPPVDPRLEVPCREAQVSQVLVNLINNAKDAILPLAEKWIRVEVSDRGVYLDISVTDSGPGISPELADKIMQPFFTTKEMGKGSGLGLSVSRSIAESHGGNLRVDADSAHTRFVFSLPKTRP